MEGADGGENSIALRLAQRHLLKLMQENFTLNPGVDETMGWGRGTYHYRRRSTK